MSDIVPKRPVLVCQGGILGGCSKARAIVKGNGHFYGLKRKQIFPLTFILADVYSPLLVTCMMSFEEVKSTHAHL
jgi:hypothetical protein